MIVLGSVPAGRVTAQTFKTLHNFQSGGGFPEQGLILLDKTLYGTTYAGNGNWTGTVFKVNIDATGFTTLHSFTGDDGTYSRGWLVPSGQTLFGTTGGGDRKSVV